MPSEITLVVARCLHSDFPYVNESPPTTSCATERAGIEFEGIASHMTESEVRKVQAESKLSLNLETRYRRSSHMDVWRLLLLNRH